MKRIIYTLLAVVFVVSYSYSMTLTGGVGLGLGMVSNSDLNETYGNGFVYNTYISFGIAGQFSLGIGYEGGYKKDGDVGIFDDVATLEISGFQLFAEYKFKSEKLVPYLKLGYGYYTVKNSFTSEEMGKYEFSEKGSGIILGGGISFPLSKSFFITGEVDYLFLEVKPFINSVNSGGIRLLAGLAVKFDI